MLPVARPTERVDVADVRVAERRCRTSLLLEARDPKGIAGQVGREELEGDLAAKARVASQPHLAHPARAERANNLVGVQARAWSEGHQGGGGLYCPASWEGQRNQSASTSNAAFGSHRMSRQRRSRGSRAPPWPSSTLTTPALRRANRAWSSLEGAVQRSG